MKEKGSIFSKKSFQNLLQKIFKKVPAAPPPPPRVPVEESAWLRKKKARKAAGLKWHHSCLWRHTKKMIAQRRAKNKAAARSRRINRKRGCRPHAAGRKK